MEPVLSRSGQGFRRRMVLQIKMTTLLVLLACLYASAAGFSQKKVSLSMNNAPLGKVFSAIIMQTGVSIMYDEALIAHAAPVSINVRDVAIEQVLDQCLRGRDLTYEMVEGNIIIKKKATPPPGPTADLLAADTAIQIRGTVTDEKGAPLPGVSVKVKDGSTGTVTNGQGVFELRATANAMLSFSYIGYEQQEQSAGTGAALSVVLKESSSGLDEVVVVGYGQAKKVNLTGAVSTVNYDKYLENRPITNSSQALAGKVTGVWVSQNSGAPGSDGATLRIRGFGTLNSTDPLVLIDGVEGRLSELNPNDIASMTVLKDAASAAIYGSRAANGVLLVTTKKGGYNSEPQLSYNGYVGMQKLGRKYERIDNSVEFMEIWNKAVVNNGGDPLFPGDVIEAFRKGGDPYKYPNINYFDEVFRTAPITEHNVSVKGGSAKQNYYLSVNYLSQDGIIKQTDTKRYGINFNMNTHVKDWLEIGGRVQVTRKITNRPYDDIDRVMYMMYNGGYPFTAPYTRDGRFGATQAVYQSGPQAGEPIVDSRNPLPDVFNGRTRYVNNFFKASLNATVDLAPGLSFKTLFSGQYNSNRRDRYNEMIYVYTDAGYQTKTLDFPAVINNYRGIDEEFYWAFYNTLNYDKKFGRHNLSAIIGTQSEERQLKPTEVQNSDPPKDGLHEVNAGTTNPLAKGNTTEWRMLSYFGRVNYNYAEKYLFEANLRADASSRFKRGNRWGYFPSVSAGWRISEEPFMKPVKFINQLKLRASWGRLGNQNIIFGGVTYDYPHLASIEQSYATSYNLGGQLMPGAALTALVDQNITWETTESTDIGLDLAVLDNRLNIEMDYFTKDTRDILVQLPIPQILGGVAAPIENVGKMKNSGFEIAANYQSNSSGNFNYRIGANLTYVTNKVVKFRENAPDQLFLIRDGYSYRSLYGYKSVGVYQTADEARAHMGNNGYVPTAGDLKYEDMNGDKRLDYQDKQVLGNTIPKYTYGINLGFTYKNWSLDFVAQGIGKVDAYTQNPWTQPLGISGGSITNRWRDAWTPENHSNTLPQIKVNDTWNRYESSFWITDISYLRIKNIQLSYSFPESWMKSIRLKGATCYLNAQNLPAFVSSKYEGFDPERNTFDSGQTLYPTPFITSFGVNVQF